MSIQRFFAAAFLLGSAFGPLHADVPLPMITLPVKVHLVHSAAHPGLQSTLQAADVRAIFAEVNAIWQQGGIRFELKGVDAVQALDIAPRRWLQRDRDWVKSALPTQQFSLAAIDLCIVRKMGPNGFFYGEPVVVSETPEFTKVKGGADNAVARVTAHELGHVLGLQHREDRTNLMASGRNGISLNQEEIQAARQRASQIMEQILPLSAMP